MTKFNNKKDAQELQRDNAMNFEMQSSLKWSSSSNNDGDDF